FVQSIDAMAEKGRTVRIGSLVVGNRDLVHGQPRAQDLGDDLIIASRLDNVWSGGVEDGAVSGFIACTTQDRSGQIGHEDGLLQKVPATHQTQRLSPSQPIE